MNWQLTECVNKRRGFPAELWPLDGVGVGRPERWDARPFATTATWREWILSSAGDVCWGCRARALDASTAIDRQMAVVEQLMLRAALFTCSRRISLAYWLPGQTWFNLWPIILYIIIIQYPAKKLGHGLFSIRSVVIDKGGWKKIHKERKPSWLSVDFSKGSDIRSRNRRSSCKSGTTFFGHKPPC